MTASIDVKSSSGIYPYTVGSDVFEGKIAALQTKYRV